MAPSSRSGRDRPAGSPGSIARGAAIRLIHAYRIAVSPFLGPACRFEPTCSRYAEEAIRRHGLIRGVYLAVRRLLRCHPFHPGGFDPVP